MDLDKRGLMLLVICIIAPMRGVRRFGCELVSPQRLAVHAIFPPSDPSS